jgi:hypothetical protein
MTIFATGRHGLKNKPVYFLALLSAFGCAENAELRTVLPGAKVYVNDKFVGLSPTTFLCAPTAVACAGAHGATSGVA